MALQEAFLRDLWVDGSDRPVEVGIPWVRQLCPAGYRAEVEAREVSKEVRVGVVESGLFLPSYGVNAKLRTNFELVWVCLADLNLYTDFAVNDLGRRLG